MRGKQTVWWPSQHSRLLRFLFRLLVGLLELFGLVAVAVGLRALDRVEMNCGAVYYALTSNMWLSTFHPTQALPSTTTILHGYLYDPSVSDTNGSRGSLIKESCSFDIKKHDRLMQWDLYW